MSTEAEKRPGVYLDSAHIRGFKSIEDLTIDFKKGLNILIGKNGAGKSNFLDVIYQILRVNHNNDITSINLASFKFVSTNNRNFSYISRRKKREISSASKNIGDRQASMETFFIDDSIKAETPENAISNRDFARQSLVYRKSLMELFTKQHYKFGEPLYVRYDLPENLDCLSNSGNIKINPESLLDFWSHPKTLNFLLYIFWTFENNHFDFPSKNKLTKSFILDNLKIQDDILNNLKSYTSIEEVRFSNSLDLYQTDKNLIIDNIKLEFKLNGHWLPWSQLSDGTRRLFYIIAEVTYADGLIFLEEPELGIHPHQFNLLMDFLKEQSEDKQIIISTHSPKALDHLSPDELDHILIAYYDLEKGTQIRHLSDKEINKAQKYMKEVGFFSDYWMLSDLE